MEKYCLIYVSSQRETGLMYACNPPRPETVDVFNYRLFSTKEEVMKFIDSHYAGSEEKLPLMDYFRPVLLFEVKKELKLKEMVEMVKRKQTVTERKFYGWKIE